MKLLSLTALILGFVGFAVLLNYGLKQNEVAECHTWQSQAKEYSQFFLADWQTEQCDTFGISIYEQLDYSDT